MATRRMFSLDVTNSDPFIEMSLEAQAVYFQLAMSADDEGFINSSTRTLRAINGSKEQVDELVSRKFIIRFESGILLVRHWFLHNYIGKDRYHNTIHTNEKAQVVLTGSVYYHMSEPECIQPVDNMETEDSIGKNSKDKDSIGESSKDESPPSLIKPTINELRDYANSIGYTAFNPQTFIAYYDENGWYDTKTQKPFDWRKRIDSWKARERDKASSNKPVHNSFNDYELKQTYDFDAIEKMLLANQPAPRQ